MEVTYAVYIKSTDTYTICYYVDRHVMRKNQDARLAMPPQMTAPWGRRPPKTTPRNAHDETRPE